MNRLRVAVAMIVTLVWAGGYLLSYFDQKVHAPAEATPVMLGVVAYLFAREIRQKVSRGPTDD